MLISDSSLEMLVDIIKIPIMGINNSKNNIETIIREIKFWFSTVSIIMINSNTKYIYKVDIDMFNIFIFIYHFI